MKIHPHPRRRLKKMWPVLGAVTIALCFTVGEAPADDKDGKGGVIISVGKAKKSKYPLAIPTGLGNGSMARTIAKVARFDMSLAGWFKPLDPRSFLADLKAEGMGIDPAKWRDVGALGVMKYRVTGTGGKISVTFNLFEVEKGTTAVLSKTYSGSKKDLRKFTHKWCNLVVKTLTGEDGFFGSRIAFVTKRRRGGKQVMAVGFDGHGTASLTRNKSLNILPAWSPGGGKVAFTSYMRNNPDLYVVGAGGGRPKRISKRYGMNTGASWSPNGSQIALTLSKDGNPEIYIINATSGAIVRRLTRNRAIDTSPAWSPSGSHIAFVSDRQGGPQIFVMSAKGGGAKRISMNGSYNTTPSWSPEKGKRILAYTTRDGGRFDIVTKDLTSGKMTRITQNQGSNEEPSFSPNGRAIAFASVRSTGSGIYIANADGTGTQKRIWKGWATSVDWGPAP